MVGFGGLLKGKDTCKRSMALPYTIKKKNKTSFKKVWYGGTFP